MARDEHGELADDGEQRELPPEVDEEDVVDCGGREEERAGHDEHRHPLPHGELGADLEPVQRACAGQRHRAGGGGVPVFLRWAIL